MNWATERAREVVNSVGFREDPEATIAVALQQVVEECIGAADAERERMDTARKKHMKAEEFLLSAAATNQALGCVEAQLAIRARFPKEEA